jgi:hypothetical protein
MCLRPFHLPPLTRLLLPRLPPPSALQKEQDFSFSDSYQPFAFIKNRPRHTTGSVLSGHFRVTPPLSLSLSLSSSPPPPPSPAPKVPFVWNLRERREGSGLFRKPGRCFCSPASHTRTKGGWGGMYSINSPFNSAAWPVVVSVWASVIYYAGTSSSPTLTWHINTNLAVLSTVVWAWGCFGVGFEHRSFCWRKWWQ